MGDDISTHLMTARPALKKIGVNIDGMFYRSSIAFVARIGSPGDTLFQSLRSGLGPLKLQFSKYDECFQSFDECAYLLFLDKISNI